MTLNQIGCIVFAPLAILLGLSAFFSLTGNAKDAGPALKSKPYVLAISTGPDLILAVRAPKYPKNFHPVHARKTGKWMLCNQVADLNVVTLGFGCAKVAKRASFVQLR